MPGTGLEGTAGVQAAFPRRGRRTSDEQPIDPALAEMYRTTALFPSIPRKVVIDDHSLVSVFTRTASFRKIIAYIQGCAESVMRTPFSAKHRAAVVAELQQRPRTAASGPAVVDVQGVRFGATVAFILTELFPFLNSLVDSIPLEDMAQQRFGNRAKREFHRQMEAVIESWMLRLVETLPSFDRAHIVPYSYDGATDKVAYQQEGERNGAATAADTTDATATAAATGARTETPADGARTVRSEASKVALARELAEYLKDSFGNPTRLDFGTGHELHFFIFLMICLEEHGDRGGCLLASPAEREKNDFVPLAVPAPAPVPEERAAAVASLRQQYVLYLFQEYILFCRRLQKHYSLEPAGSHGVWGLDDYHHIPYIFGAAQLIGKEEQPSAAAGGGAILTKDVCEKEKVWQHSDAYMYFQMIAWILANKVGPFFEHSSMLYNISAVEHWAKIYGGMVKMYAAEVLSKFNVTQHLLFGVHLPWNTTTLDQREGTAPARAG